ncbi:rod shape-determining protein RodA [Limisalsivibrio acetivorans]|uniref:rod shape-determining protein RodA n=1 Tax=Limisalsivibrio acetivorans TaxID=1304888 RepID=UPI0003B45A85|nr:rod shape-determining protein RodA [Limisalsivibrio acetivorans]
MLGLNRKHLENFDKPLFAAILILLSISVFAIYSAGYDPVTSTVRNYYIKQLFWSFLGILVFLAVSLIGHRRLVKISPWLYLLGLIALGIVLFMPPIMGAKRWIVLAGFRLQPSEFFKFVWILILAKVFFDFDTSKLSFKKLAFNFVPVIPPFLLIFLEPDLGTAGTYIVVWAILVLFLGIRRWTFIILTVAALLAAPILWSQLKPYQQQRVLTFMNPEADPFGSGYHVIQSKIGIGSGGIMGKGFLEGTQSHLKFIPERHTDFIFSVIAEETGFAGAALVVMFFAYLVVRVMKIGHLANEPTGKIIPVVVSGIIFFQFYVNVAMTVGMMPVVGIPMPLVSYGGSSLLTFMAMLGLVNSVAMRRLELPGEQ